MNGWAYGGGAIGLLLMAQQSGADLLDQALNQDLSVGGIMNEAGRMAGLGVNATDAAIIVAGAGIAYKLLQLMQPFLETLNMAWRRRLELHPPHPPEPPAKR
jgi:hypothetical protein